MRLQEVSSGAIITFNLFCYIFLKPFSTLRRGPMIIRLKDAVVDCGTATQLISSLYIDTDFEVLDSHAKYIIVVEKEGVFNTLISGKR
jgi:hypothetical protein